MKKILSINLIISIVIILGFVLSGFFSFFSFQELFKRDIEAVSELTSENIFGNVNNLMDRPINVSIAMAHDTLLRDFVKTERRDGLSPSSLNALKDYLGSYQKKYKFDSVFYISVKTGAYYHYKNGLDRIMTKENPENVWYYEFIKNPAEGALNVDNDETKNNVITIFVNYKLYDTTGELLGVVGVGMETPYIQQFLVENESRFGVRAYLINVHGDVQLSSSVTGFEGVNLFKNDSYKAMASAITMRSNAPNHRWYHTRESDGYVITRYVPNLNWYLIVEKNTLEFRNKMLSQFCISLIFMLFVLLIVLITTTSLVKKYSLKLAHTATTDRLTGLKNRESYESETARFATNIDKFHSFGVGVFDLNNLKAVNDLYGHQEGDRHLNIFAQLLSAAFEGCPAYRIGGDEFAVIFRNISEDAVLHGWETLREQMEKIEREENTPMSAAFGYAFRDAKRLNTIEDVFKEADDKMYMHKKQIRNTGK